MTNEQIRLAHIEHRAWLDLWKQLLALKAITEEDLKKPESANDTPGCLLLATIRQWGMTLTEVTVAQNVEKMMQDVKAWVPTKEQLASLCNLIHRYNRAPDDMTSHNIGLPGVIMVRFDSLWIGIEPDGYAHS